MSLRVAPRDLVRAGGARRERTRRRVRVSEYGAELGDSTDRFLQDRAAETAQAVRDVFVDGRPSSTDSGRRSPDRTSRIDNGLPVADDDAIIQITGRGGAQLTSSTLLPETAASAELRDLRPGRTSTPVIHFDDITIDGEPYRMVSRAIPQGGVIQVARSTSEAEALRSVLFGRFAVIATAVVLAAAGLGWLIAARATRPSGGSRGSPPKWPRRAISLPTSAKTIVVTRSGVSRRASRRCSARWRRAASSSTD